MLKYNRAVIFSGGGFRFALYCGIFCALEEMNHTPEIILASCGGSLAATIITAFQTNSERKEYCSSHEIYNFIMSLQLTSYSKLTNIGIDSLSRAFRSKKNLHIENIFDKYLIDMPQELDAELPSIPLKNTTTISVLTVGSKVLFDKSSVEKSSGDTKLFRRVLFTDKRTENLLKEIKLPHPSQIFFNSHIDNETDIVTDISLLSAARISISDMFYIRPVTISGNTYIGGACDLVPIEIAKMLSHEICVEYKQRYDSIEDSMVEAVLGYSGNKRLHEIHDMYADYWIDTSDVPTALKGKYVTARTNISGRCVELSLPKSYQEFVDNTNMLWEYGYNRAKEALYQSKNSKVHIRQINKYKSSDRG